MSPVPFTIVVLLSMAAAEPMKPIALKFLTLAATVDDTCHDSASFCPSGQTCCYNSIGGLSYCCPGGGVCCGTEWLHSLCCKPETHVCTTNCSSLTSDFQCEPLTEPEPESPPRDVNSQQDSATEAASEPASVVFLRMWEQQHGWRASDEGSREHCPWSSQQNKVCCNNECCEGTCCGNQVCGPKDGQCCGDHLVCTGKQDCCSYSNLNNTRKCCPSEAENDNFQCCQSNDDCAVGICCHNCACCNPRTSVCEPDGQCRDIVTQAYLPVLMVVLSGILVTFLCYVIYISWMYYRRQSYMELHSVCTACQHPVHHTNARCGLQFPNNSRTCTGCSCTGRCHDGVPCATPYTEKRRQKLRGDDDNEEDVYYSCEVVNKVCQCAECKCFQCVTETVCECVTCDCPQCAQVIWNVRNGLHCTLGVAFTLICSGGYMFLGNHHSAFWLVGVGVGTLYFSFFALNCLFHVLNR